MRGEHEHLRLPSGESSVIERINNKRLVCLALLAAWVALGLSISAVQAQGVLPKGLTQVSSVEGVTEYRLGNGLRVLLFPDESKQTTTVNITYLVGSRRENYGETGMAHLLEHLMFKGTPNHPNIPQELSQRGARPNGTTSEDRTNYFETFPATEDNLDWAVGLEADRMVNSFIARKDLDSEMTVVRNEFEAGENRPFSVLMKRLDGAAFDWHNYGKDTIGNRSDIENVDISHLQNFYRLYYQPDNAVLLVAGHFDPSKALALVAKYFAPIAKPKRLLPAEYTVEPTQDGDRLVNVHRVGDQKLLLAGYHVPSAQHADNAALRVVASALGDTPNGRLYKALVQSGKATDVGAFSTSGYDPGLLRFYAALRKDDSIDAAREAMLQVIESFAEQAPSAQEINRAKIQYAKDFDLLFANPEQLALALSNAIAQGDWRLLFLQRDSVKQVSAADVQRVARAYLKADNRSVVQFVPADKPGRPEIPPRPDVAAMLKDFKGDAALAAGEVFDPAPENIEKRTVRATLPGGLKLALLSKKTRGATVHAMLTLHFGDPQSLQNKATTAMLVGSMLSRGTKRLSRQQLEDEFDRLKARVMITAGPDMATANLQTTRENLAETLQLVVESLRQPSFPIAEFEQLQREMQAEIEGQMREPQGLAVNAFRRHFNAYPKEDPRYVATFEEQLAQLRAVTLDDVQRFHSDFYGASHAELAVVGDFDDRVATQRAGELLGDWKSPREFERLARPYHETASVDQTMETPDKANAFFIAGEPLKLRDDDPDYPALTLANYILGGGFLNSRLATRIRQKDGLSYTVGLQLTAPSLDDSGSLSGYAIYAPQNRDKLQAAFKEELARALKEGFTNDEVAAAKNGFLQSRKLARAQDGSVTAALASNLFIDRTFLWAADFDKQVAGLSPQALLDAMRRHIDLAKLSVVKTGDFTRLKP